MPSPTEARRLKHRERLISQARALDVALTVLHGRFKKDGMKKRHQVTSPAETRVVAFRDWWDECPIRLRRGQKGFSQAMLAATVGAGERTVIRWEQGSARPNARHLASLREHLGEDLAKELIAWRRSVPG